MVVLVTAVGQAWAESRKKVWIESSLDGTQQPSYVVLPDGFDPSGPPRPLVVSLHTWSNGVEQRFEVLERSASQRGWIYLFPHFRGRNSSPDACGSPKAQQDILDAVDWALKTFPVDRQRIYLTGSSGGGYMAMMMAGKYPERWTAVSAWVGISDLTAWHERHAKDGYGAMLRKSCGGAPGESAEIDEQYRVRSAKTWLAGAAKVPLELAAGVHDGYTGSVPVRQTLEAFNLVARAQGAAEVSEKEIVEISRPDGRLEQPREADTQKDPDYGRAIYLRRTAGKCRVTIFEGGHERLDEASLKWLSQHVKPSAEADR